MDPEAEDEDDEEDEEEDEDTKANKRPKTRPTRRNPITRRTRTRIDLSPIGIHPSPELRPALGIFAAFLGQFRRFPWEETKGFVCFRRIFG